MPDNLMIRLRSRPPKHIYSDNGELPFLSTRRTGDSRDASDGLGHRVHRDFLAAEFTAEAYSSDAYDRTMAEIFDHKGDSPLQRSSAPDTAP